MKTWVLGDVHNNIRALEQVFTRSDFNLEEDRLIFLGDAVDGRVSTAYQAVEFLLGIKGAIPLEGNHDTWCRQWLGVVVGGHESPPVKMSNYNEQIPSFAWLSQGGRGTKLNYESKGNVAMLRHYEHFFCKQIPYFVDELNNLYVHGGYDYWRPIAEQAVSELTWNRNLWQKAQSHGWSAEGYNHCYIGHTTTERQNNMLPLTFQNITNLDTGAGWGGKLSLYNVTDSILYQSDTSAELYPNFSYA